MNVAAFNHIKTWILIYTVCMESFYNESYKMKSLFTFTLIPFTCEWEISQLPLRYIAQYLK